MSWWMCSNCNYVFEVETPPETCPKCHAKCAFRDITRYIDEFGGSGNLNIKLVVRKVREAERREKKEAEQLAKETVKLLKERMKREAEEAKKAQEAERRGKKEAERLAKEQAKREAEEAKKAQEAEKRGKKEAERLAKEQAKREARVAKKAPEVERRGKKEAERLAKEQAKKEAEEAKKAPEVEKAVHGIDSEIYEGKIRLVVASPVGFEQVRQFQGLLQELENLRIVWVGGSADEGTIIIVSVQQPTTLIRSLSEIPMVQKVDKKGENIVVMLRTITAS
jgi:hypothetical protein